MSSEDDLKAFDLGTDDLSRNRLCSSYRNKLDELVSSARGLDEANTDFCNVSVHYIMVDNLALTTLVAGRELQCIGQDTFSG